MKETAPIASEKPGRRWDGLTLGAAALVAGPVLIDLLVSDRGRVFGYLAADAFYYLTVGRNFAEYGVLAYDQTHATNGYHPLWQLLVAALFAIAREIRAPDDFVLRAVVMLGAVLLAAALVLIARASRRAGHPLGPGITSVPLGAYAAVTAPIWIFGGLTTRLMLEGDAPLFGTLWSYTNGMESALLIAALGLVTLFFASDSPRTPGRAALAGVLLGLLTLARLDHGVFALAFLLLFAWDRPRPAVWLVATGAWLAILAAYLGLNEIFVGAALPVSGALKSSFPKVSALNFRDLEGLFEGTLETRFPLIVRMMQMLLPAAVAVAFLVASRRRADRWARILRAWAAGVLALAAYGFLYVPNYYQWHWNYPVSTLFVGLVGAEIFDALCRRQPRWVPAAVSATFLLSAIAFATLHRRPNYHERYAAFYYEEGPALRRMYTGREPRLIEYDDGIVAFTTGFPTLSGTGLALDPEAADAHRDGRFLQLAFERGHDQITSLVYAAHNAAAVRRGEDSAAARFAVRLAGRETTRFAYTPTYASNEHLFAIVRFAPRGSFGVSRVPDASAPGRPAAGDVRPGAAPQPAGP